MTKGKKLLACLLASVLLLGVLPATVFAANATVGTAFNHDVHNLVVDGNWAETAYGSVNFPEGVSTATDRGHLTYYTSYGAARSTKFQWITVRSSNPAVATARAYGSGSDLVVDFTSIGIGSCTITVEYTADVRFINGINTGQTQSYYPNGVVQYTVNVTGLPNPPMTPDAPDGPTVERLLAEGAVTVDCVNAEVGHADRTYGLLPGGYSVGQVYAVDGDYAVDVTVTPAPYAAQFEADTGAAHALEPAHQGDKTIRLLYDSQGARWSVAPGAAPVQYTVRCETPEPPPAAPDGPTVEELLAEGAVTVDCVNAEVGHADRTYGLLPGGYAVGAVMGTDGAYRCLVTVTPDPYATAYSTALGRAHSLAPREQGPLTIALRYDVELECWHVEENALPVRYTVDCEAEIVSCFVYYYSNYPAGAGNQLYTDGGADGKGYPPSSRVTVLGNRFSAPSGYRFGGWNTRPDGTGTFYAAGALLTVAGDVRLYAQWTRDGGPSPYFPLPGDTPGAGDLTGGRRPSDPTDDVNPNTGGADNGRVLTALSGSVLGLGAALALRRRRTV